MHQRELRAHPQPTDGCDTETSRAQAETEQSIINLFKTHKDVKNPILNRNGHLNWLIKLLVQGFPGRYTAQDASQSWLLYFVLQSFHTLGVAFDPDTKKKAIRTIMCKQHPDGGFGGGPGQFPHLLATYPSICALAIVGAPGPDGGWDQIDREGMYRFFMSLKQPDGSFIVSQNGEVDVRGTYCLLAVATLLDMITPELIHNTYDFLRSCQTYEGGFAASSQPYFSPAPDFKLLEEPRPYLGEAHGGYTSCAVTSLVLLRPTVPAISFPGINGDNLLRWAVMMQGSEFDEGGAFRGRTNKLVDGCYSWWVGGLFPLIEELQGESTGESVPVEEKAQSETEESWVDADGAADSLFDKDALQRYVLIAAQQPAGGLRDKPNTNADAYHTLYNLAGLSAAQHRVYYSKKRAEDIRSKWRDTDGFTPSTAPPEDNTARQARRREVFVGAHAWQEDETQGVSHFVGGAGNRVNATHPLFNLTMSASRTMMDYFYGQKTT